MLGACPQARRYGEALLVPKLFTQVSPNPASPTQQLKKKNRTRAEAVKWTGGRWNGRTVGSNAAPLENSKYPPSGADTAGPHHYIWAALCPRLARRAAAAAAAVVEVMLGSHTRRGSIRRRLLLAGSHF